MILTFVKFKVKCKIQLYAFHIQVKAKLIFGPFKQKLQMLVLGFGLLAPWFNETNRTGFHFHLSPHGGSSVALSGPILTSSARSSGCLPPSGPSGESKSYLVRNQHRQRVDARGVDVKEAAGVVPRAGWSRE